MRCKYCGATSGVQLVSRLIGGQVFDAWQCRNEAACLVRRLTESRPYRSAYLAVKAAQR